MFNLFLFVALIVFIYVSYRRPLFGVATIIALLPSYLWRLSIFGLPATFLELMIVALFVVWLLKDKKYKRINFTFSKPAKNKLSLVLRYLLLLWLLTSLVGLAINPTQAALGLWRAYWLEPMMFFLVFIYTVNSKEDLKIIIKALGLLVIWLFAMAVYQNFSTWNYLSAYNPPNAKRLTAVFSYPNALALLTAPLTALFFGLWAQSKDKLRSWLYLLVFVCGALTAYLAKSEGALVALVVCLVLWLILAKNIRKYGQPIVGLLIILAFLFLPIGNYIHSFKQQLFTPVLNLQATSLEIRSSQWQETWSMLEKKFVWGSGIRGYQAAVAPWHQEEWLEIYLYPHNIFLNFWTEMSLFGLLVFVALMVYVIYLLKKLFVVKNKWAWSLTLMWLTWFIHGLVDVPYFKNDLSILFFIMLGLTLMVQQNVRKK